MPQPTKIPKAFAASGDRNTIPESTGTLGLASWNEGFPAITSVPFAEGGLAPKRADFNGIFNALSAATVWQQQGGLWAYDNTTDYEVGNVVVYNGGLYKCITANGPSSAVKNPTDATTWDAMIAASGGTFTGNLSFSQSSARLFKRDASGDFRAFGGSSSSNGAFLTLTGKDSSSVGSFSLTAHNGTDSKILTGQANGALTWDGKNLADNGAFNAMFFSQTSGTYTAPYTGVYRITLKGGGGGGGGQGTDIYSSGGGGGEGGTLIFYAQLTKDQVYSFAIGAGGSAGADGAIGNAGGATTFNAVYRAVGGLGGGSGDAYYRPGGSGGNSYLIPTGESAYFVPGACGVSGVLCTNVSDLTSAVGGGSGGGRTGSTTIAGIYGGGGGGGIFNRGATAGGDGYILIEYAG